MPVRALTRSRSTRNACRAWPKEPRVSGSRSRGGDAAGLDAAVARGGAVSVDGFERGEGIGAVRLDGERGAAQVDVLEQRPPRRRLAALVMVSKQASPPACRFAPRMRLRSTCIGYPGPYSQHFRTSTPTQCAPAS